MYLNTKSSDESSSSNLNSSFKCIMNDNDSGYISQHIESNSVGEVSDYNNHVIFSNSNMYLNEDTLLENPVTTRTEHENLFYMPDFTVIPPSVSSHGDSFHVFDSEDSEVIEETDVSLVIPVADPIVVSDLHMEPVVTSKEDDLCGSFVVDNENKDNEEDFKGNGVELNLFKHASHMEESAASTLRTNNLSCVQTRIMDANNCNMSLFESFYSFVCDLYTKDAAPLEEISNIAINPRDLLVNQGNEQSSSYIQLETRSVQDLSSGNTLPTVSTTNLSESSTSFVNAFLNPIHPEDSSSKVNASCSSTSALNNSKDSESPVKVINNDLISVTSSEKVQSISRSPVNSPNFAGAFTSVARPESNSSQDAAIIENSESISKLSEPPKLASSPTNESECTTNIAIANVSTETTDITESSAIIAKAAELSKMANKRRDSLSVRNALSGRRKLKEIKNAIPAKSILKKPQHLDSSPELFSDEEFLESRSKPVILPVHKEREELYISQTDRKLFKCAQESITGVLPPPSVTILQITIDEMLDKIKENTHLFWDNPESSANNENASTSEKCENPTTKRESLLIRCKKTDFNPESWPDILNYRYHGLHFNRNTLSEDFENLCTKYTERYIGAETQSSCTVFGINAVQSPSKHRCRLKRTVKSPGKRLSHLARRRITFSKDSLNSSASGSCAFGARTRQIMVDVRKCQMLKHKSPRKKTPVKSPRKKLTPSSSAKKRFSRRLRMYSIDDSMDSVASTSSSNSKLSATKRALFQSPSQRSDNRSLTQSHSKVVPPAELSQSATRRTPRRALFPSPLKTSPTKMTISSLYPPKRKLTPKRALFTSPDKLLRSASTNDRKRKRTDSDCEQPSKAVNNLTEDMRKVTDGTPSATTQSLTANRKKKLMWAVAEALRLQNIDLKHPQFKTYASVLARVIRNFLPNLFVNGVRSEGSTTENMLRIARKYVFAVTRGKSVDHIMKEAENEKLKAVKPSGYVGPNKIEECNNSSQSKHKEGVLQDRLNIISTEKEVSENNKNARRGGNVERIRKVINFGDDDVKNTSIR